MTLELIRTVRALAVVATAALLLVAHGPSANAQAAPTLSSLSLVPAAAFRGQLVSGTATVALSGPAPQGGTTVQLPPIPGVTMPATVLVPQGASSATFAFSTTPSGTGNVILYALLGSVTRQAVLRVDGISFTVTLSPETAVGGATLNGSVSMGTTVVNTGQRIGDGPAPQNLTITLAPYGPESAGLTLPQRTVTIPAGQRSANFTVQSAAVGRETRVAVQASMDGWSSIGWATLQAIRISALAVNPPRVTAGTAATGTVTLSAPAPAGGFTVGLQRSGAQGAPWHVVSVPATFTIPAGSASGTFTVATDVWASNYPATDYTFTVQADRAGGSSSGTGASASFVVMPGTASAARVSALTLTPATVVGGARVTGRVTLSEAAPAGGKTVLLARFAECCAALPATVTVPAGSTTADFEIGTEGSTARKEIGVKAQLGGYDKTAILVVEPVKLASLTAANARVRSGGSTQATLALTGPAPSGSVRVRLSSSNTGAVTLPVDVLIPGGQASATFPISLAATAAPGEIVITANLGQGEAKTLTLRVDPPLDMLKNQNDLRKMQAPIERLPLKK